MIKSPQEEHGGALKISSGGISGRFRRVEDRYNRYDVVDGDGDKVGTVDHTYVSESNLREYVAVSSGLTGLLPGTGSSIIPLDVCAADNTSRTIQVNAEKDLVKNSPSLGSGDEMSPEYGSQVRSYYRL
jgi:PRC-barrel domain protein